MSHPNPDAPPLPGDGRLMKALAVIQAHADLETAKAWAAWLDADSLQQLREWIDARLAGMGKPTAAAPGALSQREEETLRLLALGYSNKQIAALMNVSVKTVETYKARGMEKIKLRTRVELVRYAIARGWMETT